MVAVVIAIAVKTGGEVALAVTVHVEGDHQLIHQYTRHQGPSLDQDLALMTKSVCIKNPQNTVHVENFFLRQQKSSPNALINQL